MWAKAFRWTSGLCAGSSYWSFPCPREEGHSLPESSSVYSGQQVFSLSSFAGQSDKVVSIHGSCPGPGGVSLDMVYLQRNCTERERVLGYLVCARSGRWETARILSQLIVAKFYIHINFFIPDLSVFFSFLSVFFFRVFVCEWGLQKSPINVISLVSN